MLPTQDLYKDIKHINPEIYQSEPHVFTAESKAQTGEKIYLRMELITKNNQPHIEQFIQQTLYLAGTWARLGLLSYLPNYIEPVGDANYAFTSEASSLHTRDRYNKKTTPLEYFKEASGYSDEELQKFINYLGRNGFHSKNENIVNLRETGGGACFLSSNINAGHYFVYACKNPTFSIQDTLLSDKKLSLKEFILQYQDILACVGSTYTNSNSTSRGIFRNPINTIEKNYKGVAIALIGFSGAVAYRFLNKKETYIRPIGRMPGILCAALKKNEFSVRDLSDEQVRERAANKTASFEYQGFTIKLQALYRIFKESQEVDEEITLNFLEQEQQPKQQNRYRMFKIAACAAGAASLVTAGLLAKYGL